MTRATTALGAVLAATAASVASLVWAQPKPAWRDPETLDRASIPADSSPLPKREEWSSATPLEVRRRTTRARGCTATRLREYVKVRCPYMTAGVRQYIGDTKDVEIFVTPRSADGNVMQPPHGAEVVFPLRKGSGRLFRFFEIVSDYSGFGIAEGVLVDVTWPESRDVPTVVLR